MRQETKYGTYSLTSPSIKNGPSSFFLCPSFWIVNDDDPKESIRVRTCQVCNTSCSHTWLSRGQTMVSKTEKRPLEDQTPKEGEYLVMAPVHIPPTMNDSSVWFSTSYLGLVTVVDHENYRCSWRNVSLPRWLLVAERWHAVSTVLGGGTKYESIEVFSGVAAIFLRVFMGNGLRRGFVAMGDALKRRCEEGYY